MTGEEIFHPDTRALLAYGRSLAGLRAAPTQTTGKRADHVLERLFVFERTPDRRWPLRSFGAELATLFGRDLRDHDFAALWLGPDRALVDALIEAAAAAEAPGVARVHAEAFSGQRIGAEVLVTPLKVDQHFGARFLGMVQPLGGEPFLNGAPIHRLRLISVHPPLARAPGPVRLVINNDAAAPR